MFEEVTLNENARMIEEHAFVAEMKVDSNRTIALNKFVTIQKEIEEAVVASLSKYPIKVEEFAVADDAVIRCIIKHDNSGRMFNCLISPVNKETRLLDETASTKDIADGICSIIHKTSISWINGPKNSRKNGNVQNGNAATKLSKAEKRRQQNLQREEEARKARELKDAAKRLYTAMRPRINKESKIIQFDENGLMCINGRKTVESILDYIYDGFENNKVSVEEIDATITNNTKVRKTAIETYKAYVGRFANGKKISFLSVVDGIGFEEIKNAHREYKNAISLWSNIVYLAPKKSVSDRVNAWCTIDKPGVLMLETDLCLVAISKNKIKSFEIKEFAQEYFNTVSSSKYKEAAKYITNQIKDSPYQINYKSGNGLLSKTGAVSITVKSAKYSLSMTYKLSCEYSKGNSWKQEFKKCLQGVEKEMDKSVESVKNEEEKRFEQFKGSLIPAEIVNIVSTNGHITEKNVIGALRGTYTSFDVKSVKGAKLGCFNFVDDDTMSSLIRRMYKAGILYTVRIDGKHCRYDALKTKYSNVEGLLEYKPKTFAAVKKLVKEKATLNYYDALQYFKSFEGKDITVQDYINLLHLVNTSEFISLHEGAYVKMFKTAPKEFKDFVKMIRENEEERKIRKLYKEIIDAVGK